MDQFTLEAFRTPSIHSSVFVMFLMITLSCAVATEQPDIEATIDARVAAAEASLVAPTAMPLPTYTPVPTPKPEIIIKELVIEKPVEILVEKLVVKEMPLEGSKGVVPIIQFVEVIKEVPVEIVTEVLVEVVATATPLPRVTDSFDMGDDILITLTLKDKETGKALSDTHIWIYHTIRNGAYYWPDEMLTYGIKQDNIDAAVKNVGNINCSCWHIKTDSFGQITIRTYIPGAQNDDVPPHLHIAWIDGYGDGVLVFEMLSGKQIGPIKTIYHQNVFPLKMLRGQRGWEATAIIEKFKID